MYKNYPVKNYYSFYGIIFIHIKGVKIHSFIWILAPLIDRNCGFVYRNCGFVYIDQKIETILRGRPYNLS